LQPAKIVYTTKSYKNLTNNVNYVIFFNKSKKDFWVEMRGKRGIQEVISKK